MEKLPRRTHGDSNSSDNAVPAARHCGGVNERRECRGKERGMPKEEEREGERFVGEHICRGTASLPPEMQHSARRRGICMDDAECVSMGRGLRCGNREPAEEQSPRQGWARRQASQALILVCICLLWQPGGGDDSSALEAARLRLADTFDLRKQLSGESTYPHRYRSSPDVTGNCCGGDRCVECQGEKVGNLDATRLHFENEIRLLRKLGCPCRIEKLNPFGGPIEGGTDVVITVSGLDLDTALSRGPIDCWIRMGLENYIVKPTTRVLGSTNQLTCRTPSSAPQYSQITLHAADFAVTAGATQFSYYSAGAPRLVSILPSGAPSSPGGAVLTITGSGFQDAINAGVSLWCIFGGVPFDAAVQSNETAICVSPVGLPAVLGKLYISFNTLDPAGTDTLDFAVYDQPRIARIWPMGGYGNEPIVIQAAGLGFTYQPRDGDISCIFLQQHQEKIVPAQRVANSSTVTCVVPNNTRQDHIITGEVRVEISIIGEQRSVLPLPNHFYLLALFLSFASV